MSISKHIREHIVLGVPSLKDVFNVKQIGAVGDGVTDDSAAIQDAIDAAETAGSGIVYFPAGVYLIATTLTLSLGGIRFKGEGFVIDYTSHACPNSPGWGIDEIGGTVIKGDVGDEIAISARTTAVANSSLAVEPLGLVQIDGIGFKNLGSAIKAGAQNQYSFGAFTLEKCAFDDIDGWAIDIENAQDIVLREFWGSECKKGVRIAQDHDVCAPGTTNMTDFFMQLRSIQGAVADYLQRYGVFLEVVGGTTNAFLDAVVLDKFFVWAIGEYSQDTVAVYCKGASSSKSVNAPTINGAMDGDMNYCIVLEDTLDSRVSFTSVSDNLFGTLYPFTADNETNTITATGHTWEVGQPVFVATDGGSLPTGLNVRDTSDLVPYDYTDQTNSIYYVANPSGDTLQLSTTDTNRYADTRATFSDDGSGDLYICEAKAPIVKGIGAKRTHISNQFSSQWMHFDSTSPPWSLEGLCLGFGFKSTLPSLGGWYDEGTAKSYTAGTATRLGMEFNVATSGYGPTIDHARTSSLIERVASSPLWMYTRAMQRRTLYQYTGSKIIGADQLGLLVCAPPGGGLTITLPAIGDTGAVASVGAFTCIENRTGGGTITVSGSVGAGPGADTIGWAANYVIPAVAGNSVTLMSSGPSSGGGAANWVIVGSN